MGGTRGRGKIHLLQGSTCVPDILLHLAGAQPPTNEVPGVPAKRRRAVVMNAKRNGLKLED